MVKVEFLGPIGAEPIELDITSLDELAEYMASKDALKEWSKSSAVAVNDTIIKDRNYQLKDGDVVTILPPVCGG